MLWQENPAEAEFTVPDDVADLSFKIGCKRLPLDHAHALESAIHNTLPWLSDEPDAGIHSIHGAASGNGWQRPHNTGEGIIHLPKRARLSIRLPKHRMEAATTLSGQTLAVDGHTIEIGASRVKPLIVSKTIFARSIIANKHHDEETFTQQLIDELKTLNIHARKMLCGLTHAINTPEGDLCARSVMLADLNAHESIALQQRGVGLFKTKGCGLFLPHKDIASIKANTETDSN
ncbi:MAG: type I-MYXAN CRISPR-associated protein Cas6/Cmx6 [Arenicellales bacterium WSBS_2016_MAG_OTU3]